MIKKMLMICVCILFIGAAQGQNKQAAKYNNKIIDIQYKLVPDVIAFFKAMESGNAVDLKTRKDKLTKDFDKAILTVNGMKGFEGDIELRDAALSWFRLYEATLEVEYEHIIQLVSITKDKRTEEDKAKFSKLYEELVAKEGEIDEKFHQAQMAFSKKHNLELREYAIGQNE